MKHFNFLIFLIFCAFVSTKAIANNCGSATFIVPSQLSSQSQQNGNLASAGWSGTSQCAGPGANNDMWYTFISPASRIFVSATGQDDLDVAVELYSICGGAPVACLNSAGPGGNEVLNAVVTAGAQYYVMVYHAGTGEPLNQNFTLSVYFIPFVELRSLDCDNFSLNTNDIIRSTQPGPSQFTVANYQWRFVELDPPFNTYEIISPNGTNPNYRLEWMPAPKYGMTYDVSVRIRVAEGQYWGDYGQSCTIAFQPTVLTTRLEQQYANGFFNFCNTVGADKVGAATRYRWVFNDLETPVSLYGKGDSRMLALQTVPGLKLAQTYIVQVFAEVNGDESPAGTSRFITMNPTVPPTGLNQNVHPCGQTYPVNTQVQAVEICSAQAYTWRFTNTSQSQPAILYTRTGGSRFIRLDWVEGLIIGDSYNVEVRAQQGNLTGSYSSVCNITIAASTAGGGGNPLLLSQMDFEDGSTGFDVAGESAQLDVVAFAHPNNTGSIQLQIVSQSAQSIFTLELYTANGQLVAQKNVQHNPDNLITWSTGQNAKGIYILKVSDGEHTATKKVSFL